MLRKLVIRSFFFLKGGAQEGGGSLGAGLLVQGGGDFEKSSLATGKSLQKNGEHLCRKWHHWGWCWGRGGQGLGLGHMTAKMKREKRKKRGIAIRVLTEASQVKETRRGGIWWRLALVSKNQIHFYLVWRCITDWRSHARHIKRCERQACLNQPAEPSLRSLQITQQGYVQREKANKNWTYIDI